MYLFWVNFFSFCFRKDQTQEGLWKGHTSVSLQDYFAWRWDQERGAEEAANGDWVLRKFSCVWGLSKDVPGQGWIFWSQDSPKPIQWKGHGPLEYRLRSENEGGWVTGGGTNGRRNQGGLWSSGSDNPLQGKDSRALCWNVPSLKYLRTSEK